MNLKHEHHEKHRFDTINSLRFKGVRFGAILAFATTLSVPSPADAQTCQDQPVNSSVNTGYDYAAGPYMFLSGDRQNGKCTCFYRTWLVYCAAPEWYLDQTHGAIELPNCEYPCSAHPAHSQILDFDAGPMYNDSSHQWFGCGDGGSRIDQDGDLWLNGIGDQGDDDYRVIHRHAYDHCDGVSNDGDACVDEGYTWQVTNGSGGFITKYAPPSPACNREELQGIWNNGHGAPSGQLNLRWGYVLRSESDSEDLTTPNGNLPFTRIYNSRNADIITLGNIGSGDVNPLGKYWTHNYNMFVVETEVDWNGLIDSVKYMMVRMPDGSQEYFVCRQHPDGANEGYTCTHFGAHTSVGFGARSEGLQLLQRNYGNGLQWRLYPGDGTYYDFEPGGFRVAERRDEVHDEVIWQAQYSGNPRRLTTVFSGLSTKKLEFTYDTSGFLRGVNLAGGIPIARYTVDASAKRLYKVEYATNPGVIDPNNHVAYTYDSSGLLDKVRTRIDGTTVDIADYDFTNGQMTRVRSTQFDYSVVYSGVSTRVTYNDVESPKTVLFNHNGRAHINNRSGSTTYSHLPRMEKRDFRNRTICTQSDQGEMVEYFYEHSGTPENPERHVLTVDYGTSATCDNPTGKVAVRADWAGFRFDIDSHSWRPWYRSSRSVFGQGSEVCKAASGSHDLPAYCRGRIFEYAGGVTGGNTASGHLLRTYDIGYSEKRDGTDVRQVRVVERKAGQAACGAVPNYQFGSLPCEIVVEDWTNPSNKIQVGRQVFEFDSDGYISSKKEYKSATQYLTTQYLNRNSWGKPEEVVQPNGVTIASTYTGWGALQTVEARGLYEDPGGGLLDAQTTYVYNEMRAVKEVIGPLGIKTVATYKKGSTDYGRVHALIAAGTSANIKYYAQRFSYDPLGRAVEVNTVDILNSPACSDEDCTSVAQRQRFDFDATGRLVKNYRYTSDALDPADSIASNDWVGDILVETTAFDGTRTSYSYDSIGRLQDVTGDQGGLDARFDLSYNSVDRITNIVAPEVVPGGGIRVQTARRSDDFGRTLWEDSQSIGGRYLEYDVLGRLTRLTRVNAGSGYDGVRPSPTHEEEICYLYDWMNRITVINENCDDGSPEWEYEYDEDNGILCPNGATHNVGRLTEMTSHYAPFSRRLCYHGSGDVSASYTALNTVSFDLYKAVGSRWFYNEGGTLTDVYHLDRPFDDSHRIHIQYVRHASQLNSAGAVRFRLGPSGVWNNITSQALGDDIQYNAFGSIKRMVFANGLTSENNVDLRGRPNRLRVFGAGNPDAMDLHLEYDDNDNVIKWDDSNGRTGLRRFFGYDEFNRLTCVMRSDEVSANNSCRTGQQMQYTAVEAFEYDGPGSRTRQQYTEKVVRQSPRVTSDESAFRRLGATDKLDVVEQPVGYSFGLQHDFKGNAIQREVPHGLGAFVSWNWNSHNRMVSASGHNGGAVTKYRYAEPAGDLVWKSIPVGVDPVEAQFFFRNVSSPQLEASLLELPTMNGDAYSATVFIYMDGRPIAMVETFQPAQGTPTIEDVFWIHTDHTGTPVVVTDDQAAPVWRWERDPFGAREPMRVRATLQDVAPPVEPAPTGSGVVLDEVFTVPNGRNIRVHFTGFQTDNLDLVEIINEANGEVIEVLTGNLGDVWSEWADPSWGKHPTEQIRVRYTAINRANVPEFSIDKIEYYDGPGSIIDNTYMDLRFPGQFWDADAGAFYGNQRWYRPELGRYLSPDPAGIEGGTANYFEYAAGNPMSYGDPSGRFVTKLITCITSFFTRCGGGRNNEPGPIRGQYGQVPYYGIGPGGDPQPPRIVQYDPNKGTLEVPEVTLAGPPAEPDVFGTEEPNQPAPRPRTWGCFLFNIGCAPEVNIETSAAEAGTGGASPMPIEPCDPSLNGIDEHNREGVCLALRRRDRQICRGMFQGDHGARARCLKPCWLEIPNLPPYARPAVPALSALGCNDATIPARICDRRWLGTGDHLVL